MSKAQDTLDVSDLKENFLECSVCLEHFDQSERRPRLLVNCLHAFCTQCLEQLLKKEGRGQVTCPNCRQVQEVKGSAQSLPVDPVRNKLVDYVQFKRGKTIPCTECPDGSHAVARCHDCQSYMCVRCKEAHHRNRLSRKHTCQSLEEALSEPVKSFLSHFCKDHPDHKIEFYCEQCSSLCCVSCFIWKHKGHDLVPIDDAANKMMSSLKTKTENIGKSVSVLRKEKISLEEESSQQELNLIQTTFSLNQTFEKLIEQLKIRQSQLINELKQKTESTINGLKKQCEDKEDSIAQMESTIEYFKQMESKSDDCEVLSAGPVLVQSLDAVGAVDQTQDVQYPTLTFSPGDISSIISKVQTFGGIYSKTNDADQEGSREEGFPRKMKHSDKISKHVGPYSVFRKKAERDQQNSVYDRELPATKKYSQRELSLRAKRAVGGWSFGSPDAKFNQPIDNDDGTFVNGVLVVRDLNEDEELVDRVIATRTPIT